jgi:predicted dehydrogenase
MNIHFATSPETRVLLIGAGFIAAEYVKTLHALGVRNITVLARTESRAYALKEQYTLAAAHGGGEAMLPQLLPDADAVIVATSIEALPAYAALLAEANHPRVLLEKPAFLSAAALQAFQARYPRWDCAVALNRLYYPSVRLLATHMAAEGTRSASFSFTEWVHRIDPKDYTPNVLVRWGLSNCIHVIATAFWLIGLPQPKALQAHQGGMDEIPWHPAGSIFTGAGLSIRNIPFTYHSDWGSAGRWMLDVRTPRGAYALCPMEGLFFTPKGSVTPEPLLPVWAGETKCGFEAMLYGFLTGEDRFLLSQLPPYLTAIETIFGYSDAA